MDSLLNETLADLLAKTWNMAAWLVGLAVFFVPLEFFCAATPKKVFRKGLLIDLGYYFLNGLALASLLSIPMSFVAIAVQRWIPAALLEATADLNVWTKIVVGFLISETGYYWGHRLSHQVPFLWRFHAIHHSAEQLDFLVNTRAHPVDMVFSRFMALAPMYLLGFGNKGKISISGNLVPLVVTLVPAVWGFFIHANLKWRFGPLEWLFSTPAFHHWHHTKSGPINRNFSSNLPWLDALFGTLYLPKELPTDYGIDSPVPDKLIDQLLYPLAPEVSLKETTTQEPTT
ncbi:MAG: sterol desaturase family protein [Planctomycetota bacterium]|nr:sterol desaturase family protein [Planctomycetota bacterium]